MEVHDNQHATGDQYKEMRILLDRSRPNPNPNQNQNQNPNYNPNPDHNHNPNPNPTGQDPILSPTLSPTCQASSKSLIMHSALTHVDLPNPNLSTDVSGGLPEPTFS